MASIRDLNRRDLFRASGRVAAAGGALWFVGSTSDGQLASAGPESSRPDGFVTVSEGTNMSATLSPDGKWIAFDLCTGIWLLPAAGGTARKLTDDFQDATRPQFSPDSRHLVFQSYRDNNYHLWTIGVDGSGLRQLTVGRHDHREPKYSPDGRRIVCSSDRGAGYGIWIYDLESGQITPVTDSDVDEAEPSWSPDGTRVVFSVDEEAIEEVTLGGARRRIVEPAKGVELFAPSYTPDGSAVIYTRLHGPESVLMVDDKPVTQGEDVFVFGAQWISGGRLLYTADGAIRIREFDGGRVSEVPFTAELPYRRHQDRPAPRDQFSAAPQQVRGIASPVLSPDGQHVAFRALGALWTLQIGQKPRQIVADGNFHSDPDWFPDGRSLVYSSDRDGRPALWRHDLITGAQRKLAELPGAQLTPRCSPDGTHIAYQDENGATWVLNLGNAQARKVLPPLFQPGRPSWSPDGRMLALAAVKPFSKRFREGTSQILTVDLTTGEIRYTEPTRFGSLSTRGDDGPVWSPDGSRFAFVVNSLLHIVEIDDRGQFTGQPRPINDEVTDAPTFSGDSRTLLYLNNGRLRLLPVSGGKPRTVETSLTWTRTRPRGRTVIRAGAVWDGKSQRLRRDVDVVVEADRIAAVEERDESRADPIVDASRFTVMPGMIDSHNHWHLRGRHWGARQGRLWLSYGITTTRSPGDPVYQMLETREALDSGAMLGPRYLATGEAVDGGRIYYNFMRPTHGAEALERELERASALEYDLIKTYVRLPVEMQRTAIVSAHQRGQPLSSHYLYPAVNLGMDGMEHTGATNRLGYSHTVSKLGRSYGDALELFTKSGMSITPTLFNSKALYADDRSLVDDPRTRALFPSWEYERLVRKADGANAPTPKAEYTRRALAANVAMLLRIHRGGGFVIAGTDAPLDDIAVSFHQNLRAMVRHGFTPYEALVVATRNPARWLGLGEQLAAVRPGFLADLAVVEGDPLKDIRAAANVRMVVTRGTVHQVGDLIAPYSGSGDGGSSGPRTSRAKTTIAASAASADEARYWWHGESEPSLHVCC